MVAGIRYISAAGLALSLLAAAWVLVAWVRGQVLGHTGAAPQGVVGVLAADTARLAAPPATDLPFDPAAFAQPPMDCRPRVRWWWPTTDLADLDLIAALQQLYELGYGGVEVYTLRTGLPPQAGPVRSPDEHRRRLALLLREARKRGMTVGLAAGPGALPGGRPTRLTASLRTLAFGEANVLGGKTIDIACPPPRIPGAYYYSTLLGPGNPLGAASLRFFPETAQPLAIYAAKPREATRAGPALNLGDFVRLDPDSTYLLPDSLLADGRVRWAAPPGYWKIIAIYHMPAGQRWAESTADEDAFVVDYLDPQRLVSHQQALTKGLAGSPALHSLAYDDLKPAVERHYLPGLLDFFRMKRGYDLLPYLPLALETGADNYLIERAGLHQGPEYVLGEDDARMRHDYAQTVSDWMCDSVLPAARSHAAAQGLELHMQLHGLDIDLVRAAGEVDVPETEQRYAGGSLLSLKTAVSGALLARRQRVGAEALGFERLDGALYPLRAKIAADKLFAAGINDLLLHGAPFPVRGGWQPFASPHYAATSLSGDFSARNTFADHLPMLNAYLGRCQYVLRQGQPEVDVVIHYPFLGFPAALLQNGGIDEFLLGGYLPGVDSMTARDPSLPTWGLPKRRDPRIAWLEQVWPLIETLENRGLSWVWASAASLDSAYLDGDRLVVGAVSARMVLLPDLPTIGWTTAGRLYQLREMGGRVLVYGQPPVHQPGFYDHEQRDGDVRRWMEALAYPGRPQHPEDFDNYLAAFAIDKPLAYSEPYPFLRQCSRVLSDGGRLVFLSNTLDLARNFTLTGAGAFAHVYLLDPRKGALHALQPDGQGRLALRLEAYGSLIVYGAADALPDSVLSPIGRVDRAFPETDFPLVEEMRGWDILVQGNDVPGGTCSYRDTLLFDWRSDKRLCKTSSEGLYTHSFLLGDTIAGKRYLLDLGRVVATADVRVNTVWVGQLVFPPYRVDITEQLAPGLNTIEVWVRPPALNGLLDAADRRTRHIYRGREPLPAGLLGPVQLWEIDP
ncbi:MAG: hypothetical protein OHK0039_09630 [Bacteroidia bacterium]